MEAIEKIIVDSNEEEFLKYVHDCCNNILENKEFVRAYGLLPPMLQLYKMRNEVELRMDVLANRKGV